MPIVHKASITSKLKIRIIVCLLGWILFISPSTFINDWQLIKKRGVLNFGTRTSLLTYFETSEGKTGYEFMVLQEFCKANNITLNPIVFDNNSDLFEQLDQGHIDIAGASLSITAERQKNYDFSAPIDQSSIEVVVHSDLKNIKSFDDLKSKKGLITAQSSYAELFTSMPDASQWNITITHDESLYDLVEKVSNKKIDFTFADSNIIKIYKNFVLGIYDNIRLTKSQDTAFMLRKQRDPEFLDLLDAYIISHLQAGALSQIKQEIIDHLPKIHAADTVNFLKNYKARWPLIKDLVFEVSDTYQVDPMLIAAISYQESHWKPEAISYTGVKGLMMLTKSVAEELDISDRTDPYQSLDGGVRYFLKMLDKIPKRITEPDKTNFALAAYNIGYGHLEDARILTQRNKKDPDKWDEVKHFLHLLNDKNLSDKLKLGNADGKTAVIYVNNIITYRNLILWNEQKNN